MKTRNLTRLIISSAALLLVPASLVHAKEWHDGGTGTYIVTSSNSVAQPNGSTVVFQSFKGVVLSNDSKSILNLTSQSGAGTTVFDKDGNLVESNGYADGVDRDGDVFWIWWKTTPNGGTWGYTGGTGKFAGIKGGGTTKTLVNFPGDRWTISWEGNVSLP